MEMGKTGHKAEVGGGQMRRSVLDVLNLRCVLYTQEEVANRPLDIQVWSVGKRSELQIQICELSAFGWVYVAVSEC